MQVKYDGRIYDVSFGHEKVFKSRGSKETVPYATKCTISSVKGKQVTTISTGYGKTAHGDQFCRKTGRRVALHKALVHVWPESSVQYSPVSGIQKTIAPGKNREVRTAFWKAYFKDVEKSGS